MKPHAFAVFIVFMLVSGCSASLDAQPSQKTIESTKGSGTPSNAGCTIQSEFDAATFTQYTESFVKPADLGSCWVIKPLNNSLAADSMSIKHFWTGQYSVPFEEGEIVGFGQAMYTKGTETVQSIPTILYVYQFSSANIADNYFTQLHESYERSLSEADYIKAIEAPENCFSYKTLINIATLCKKDDKLFALNVQTVNLIYYKLKLNAPSAEEARIRVDKIEDEEQRAAHDSFMRALGKIIN